MKKIILLSFLCFGFLLNAQIFNPVEWSFSQNKISENEIELTFTAKIDSGWYVYSQYAGEGPVSTEFTFSESESFILQDKVKEGKAITEFDPNFDVVLSYFKKEAVFTQLIQISSEEDFLINGDVYFMTCDAGQCLPPEAVELTDRDGLKYVIGSQNTYELNRIIKVILKN